MQTRRVTALLAPVLLAAVLVTGCSKAHGTRSSSVAPPPAPTVTANAPAADTSAQENADLTNAQQDLADLDTQMSQVDAGLSANQATEGEQIP
jgi:ABC-type oligopeptide transport system substrate-binding subunit